MAAKVTNSWLLTPFSDYKAPEDEKNGAVILWTDQKREKRARLHLNQLQRRMGDKIRVVVQPLFRQEVMALFRAYGQECTQHLFLQNPAHISLLARFDIALIQASSENFNKSIAIKRVELFWKKVATLPEGAIYYQNTRELFHQVFIDPLETLARGVSSDIKTAFRTCAAKAFKLFSDFPDQLKQIASVGDRFLKKQLKAVVNEDNQFALRYLSVQKSIYVVPLTQYLIYKEWKFLMEEELFFQRRDLVLTALLTPLEAKFVALREEYAMIESEQGKQMLGMLAERRLRMERLRWQVLQLHDPLPIFRLDSAGLKEIKPQIPKFDWFVIHLHDSHRLFDVFERVIDPSQFKASSFPDLLHRTLELKLRCIPFPAAAK